MDPGTLEGPKFGGGESNKGTSINDVSSEGEGGGPPSKPIYYISLFSKA